MTAYQPLPASHVTAAIVMAIAVSSSSAAMAHIGVGSSSPAVSDVSTSSDVVEQLLLAHIGRQNHCPP
jgi:hypothetical protein